MTLCLCCGSFYPNHSNCPNLDDGQHSVHHAAAVANHLISQGITGTATPEQVKDARDYLRKELS